MKSLGSSTYQNYLLFSSPELRGLTLNGLFSMPC